LHGWWGKGVIKGGRERARSNDGRREKNKERIEQQN
jgi:hypothetical protein